MVSADLQAVSRTQSPFLSFIYKVLPKKIKKIINKTPHSKDRKNKSAPLDSLSQLPDEIALSIFSWVEAKDLFHLSLINKRFYMLTTDSNLWKPLFKTRFPYIILNDQADLNWKEQYKEQFHPELIILEEVRKDAHAIKFNTTLPYVLYTGIGIDHVISTRKLILSKKGEFKTIYHQQDQSRAIKTKHGKFKNTSLTDWNVGVRVNELYINLVIANKASDLRTITTQCQRIDTFIPEIRVCGLKALNKVQMETIKKLQARIDKWMQETVQDPYLNQRVAKTLSLDFDLANPLENVSINKLLITNTHKAYLLFFIELIKETSSNREV